MKKKDYNYAIIDSPPFSVIQQVLGIFVDLIHDCVEVYIDEFTVYGNEYNNTNFSGRGHIEQQGNAPNSLIVGLLRGGVNQ